MARNRVFIGDLTRKEFRERIGDGTIRAAIVPTAATEQHLEHLEMIHDTASVAYMAEHAALKLYPQVVVASPIAIGVSEHWMEHKGTLTVRPEIFTEYVYDVCDALKRGGVTNILILNGHGGNVVPMMNRMDYFRASWASMCVSIPTGTPIRLMSSTSTWNRSGFPAMPTSTRPPWPWRSFPTVSTQRTWKWRVPRGLERRRRAKRSRPSPWMA